MQQIFTTLVTWRQLEQYLFPRLRAIWKATPFRKAAPLDPDRNVFLHKVGLCMSRKVTTVQVDLRKSTSLLIAYICVPMSIGYFLTYGTAVDNFTNCI